MTIKEPQARTRAARTDGETTRTRIMEVAGQLFGDLGFAETTSKTIAQSAGVDIASINYHFGNRSGLYKAVLTEAHRRLISLDEVTHIEACAIPPSEKLRDLLRIVVSRALGPQGWNAHVIARELLSPTSHLDVLFEEEMPPKFRILARIIAEITGLSASDPCVLRCAVSAGAPCAMLFVIGRNPNPLTAQIQGLPQELVVEHLHTFAMGGLEAIARKHRA